MRGLAAGLSILLLITAIFSGYLFLEVDRLQGEVVELTSQVGELEASLREVKEENKRLKMEVENLTSERDNLLEERELLLERIGELEDERDSLTSRVEELEEALSQYIAEEALRIGNNLTSYYDAVRARYGLGGEDYGEGEYPGVEFAAKLAYHDLGNPCWPKIEEEFHEELGVHSHEAAWRHLERALSLAGVDAEMDAVERVERILSFLHDYVTYQGEVDEVIRAPVETLSLGSGDCDDYSTLAAALLEAVGVDSAVAIFKDAEENYHYMVLIHLNDLGIYNYTYYDDLTAYGLSPGRWIVIEPQYLIERQGYLKWFNRWSLEAAAEVD